MKIICPLTTTRSTQRCVVDSRTFYEKGYNAKSLPVVVLVFDVFQLRYSKNTLQKHHGIMTGMKRSFTISLLYLLHIFYKHRTLLLLLLYKVHVYITTGPLYLPLTLHTSNDPYSSNQNYYSTCSNSISISSIVEPCF